MLNITKMLRKTTKILSRSNAFKRTILEIFTYKRSGEKSEQEKKLQSGYKVIYKLSDK